MNIQSPLAPSHDYLPALLTRKTLPVSFDRAQTVSHVSLVPRKVTRASPKCCVASLVLWYFKGVHLVEYLLRPSFALCPPGSDASGLLMSGGCCRQQSEYRLHVATRMGGCHTNSGVPTAAFDFECQESGDGAFRLWRRLHGDVRTLVPAY